MTENLAGLVKLIGITIILILLWMILSVYAGDSFLDAGNLTNLMRRVSIFSILGIGVAMVIMIGGIDLSLGSLVCLTACCLALFLQVDYQPFQNIDVIEIQKEKSELVVAAQPQLEVGDVLRLHSADRNRSSTLTVQSATAESNEDGAVQRLKVTGGLQRSVVGTRATPIGKVSPATLVRAMGTENENVGSLSIDNSSDLQDVAPRDQVWLLDRSGGFKVETISRVDTAGDYLDLETSLERPLAPGWLAIPLERRQGMSVPTAILCAILIAAGLGLVHGILVTWLRLQPFVVTLSGLLMYRGMARTLSGDQSVNFGTEYVDSLNWFSMGTVEVPLPVGDGFALAFPYAFFVFVVIALIAMMMMNFTIWGRYMLALGSNEEATRLSGVATGRIKLLAYTLCGLLAGVCGVLFAIDSGSISPSSAGSYYELYAIAAAVLGGCSLRGGEGSILGVIVGTVLMQTLNNMIVLLQIPNTFEQINLGGVILIAVIVDEIVRRFFARSRRTATATEESETAS